MNTHGETWQTFFSRWPADAPRRGIVITLWNEQIPFAGFSLSADFLCLERQSPDSFGGRTIILPVTQIVGMKFTDVVKPKTLEALGFQTPPGPR
ncbi:MAG: hypothetical protein JXB10_06300 [Pirellulales bacterium]|nr:hypothetical protein [Pirellulales bacterium]